MHLPMFWGPWQVFFRSFAMLRMTERDIQDGERDIQDDERNIQDDERNAQDGKRYAQGDKCNAWADERHARGRKTVMVKTVH